MTTRRSALIQTDNFSFPLECHDFFLLHRWRCRSKKIYIFFLFNNISPSFLFKKFQLNRHLIGSFSPVRRRYCCLSTLVTRLIVIEWIELPLQVEKIGDKVFLAKGNVIGVTDERRHFVRECAGGRKWNRGPSFLLLSNPVKWRGHTRKKKKKA